MMTSVGRSGPCRSSQQVDDLRLDRHVERGHRLVADDQLRLARERPGDADALALAAGELVRIAVRVGREQADRAQQVGHALALLASGCEAVEPDRLADDVAARSCAG